MSGLTEQDRGDLYANELALDNLHSDWGRAAVEASVEAIVARHVRAALTEAASEVYRELWTQGDRETRRKNYAPGVAWRSAANTAASTIHGLATRLTPDG